MLRHFCKEQQLRALISKQSLPPALHPLVDLFKSCFQPKMRGTLFTDISAFTASAHPPSASREYPLTLEVRSGLLSWFSDNQLQMHVPYNATPIKSILHRGASYKPAKVSKGDSNVLIENVPGDWRAARIHSIFTVKAFEGQIQENRTFIAVQKFARLSSADAVHDLYRRYPLVGGRIYYDELHPKIEVVMLDEITAHFAMTPQVCSKIKRPHIHVLPLDRVSLLTFSES
jgi:hypothetical protein